MNATVWPDPEKLTHAQLAALVSEVQDTLADTEDDNVSERALYDFRETVAWLLQEAGLGPRKVG